MTTLIRCDKCGSVRKIENARGVEIKISSVKGENSIFKDLCEDCLQSFLKEINKFFGK